MKKYKNIYEELEELDEKRVYDNAKAQDDEVIPFELAVNEIENSASKTLVFKKP